MAPEASNARRQDGVTALLMAWGQGDESALNDLIPIVHGELQRVARRFMRRERGDHTLQTTAVVNEAYLRLIHQTRVTWQNRAQFFAIAARLMRRILVDHARSKNYQKRGGGAAKITLDDAVMGTTRDLNLVSLDDALEALAVIDVRKSKVVELRFFGGLSVEETAHALDVSIETVTRDWRFAKAWLLRELGGKSEG